MRRLILNLVMAFAAMTAMAQSEVPAFPGAEGHGRYTTGGRGGKIVHVTNLNDSGTGSFRAAVNGSSAKIVVFDVGGVIPLESDVTIGANTTIMGQTAPYPGITLRYYTVRPSANNIIRFIRSRRGEEKDVDDGADAIWQRRVTDMILDHCSFSWSIDEVASFYDNNNFTMQWCTIAESLNNAGHNKGQHGYGGIWGGKLASFHHNLIAHVNNRSPRFCGARYLWTGYTSNDLYDTYQWENTVQAENVDFRNCVIFNWGTGGCYGGPGGGYINIVNNYYKGGPATSSPNRVTTISVAGSGNSDSNTEIYGMTSRYYISGNTTENSSGTKIQNRDWNGVSYDSGVFTINGAYYSLDTLNYYGDTVAHVANTNGDLCVAIKLTEPCPIGEVTTHTAANAFDKVLAYAGASLDRDEVDERYMTEAESGTVTYTGSVTGTLGLIDVVADVDGYTEDTFGSSSRDDDFDTDDDGIPDAWEEANGLDPDDASDALLYTIDTKGYYSNIEVYCNSLVQEIMIAENEDASSSVDEYYPSYYDEDGNLIEVSTSESVELSDLATGSITWALDDATTTATISSDISAYISGTDVTLGSNLYIDGTTTVNGITMTRIYSTAKETSAAESNLVKFAITTADGYYFTPTSISFLISRLGTDSGQFDLYWNNSDSNLQLESSYEFNRNNEANGYMTSYSKDISSYSLDANGESDLYLYLHSTTAGKAAGLTNLIIEGTISQEASDVETGIETVKTEKAKISSKMYNLQGQRVNSSYKGVIIKNGQKYIMK